MGRIVGLPVAGRDPVHTRRLTVFVTSLVLLIAAPMAIALASPRGESAEAPYVQGEVLVKFKAGADPAVKAGARAAVAATTHHMFRSKAEQWRLGRGVEVEQAVARLRANPLVEYAEPNYVLEAQAVPNDPWFGDLWGLLNNGQSGGTPDADIDAELAWDLSTGSAAVIVGIIDTGVDYNHPDLAANVWTNPGEIPGNGLDDDGNGFVDDVHGYDFVNEDGDPFDDNGHGTHLAGTIGAVGNNGVGIVGVNWTVRIMALKFLTSTGSGTTADAVRAVDYATAMGADLTNNSYGGGTFSQTFHDAIASAGAAESAFVAPAGGSQVDLDVYPTYPASYDLPNVIVVAGTDRNDLKLSSSSWGPVTVDLGAPGGEILSTGPGGAYQLMSGSSMAAGHVSGACALIRAVSPSIPVAAMKARLMDSVDPIPSMSGIVASNGRLNLFAAISGMDTAPPAGIVDLQAVDPGSSTMGLTWTATGDDGAIGTAARYEIRHSTSPIVDASWPAATRAGNEPAPLVSGSPQAMVVRGLAADTPYYFAIKAFDEAGNAGPISNLASGSTLPGPALRPPNPVGNTLLVSLAGSDLQLDWQAALVDEDHGPADHYHVLRAESPSGPFTRVAVVMVGILSYIEPLSATKGVNAFYRVIAANAAGESG